MVEGRERWGAGEWMMKVRGKVKTEGEILSNGSNVGRTYVTSTPSK